MRKLLLDVAPYRVYPPVSGGHHAIYFADEAVSRYWDVFLFTTGLRKNVHRFPPRPEEIAINPHFREYSFVTPSLIPLCFLTRQGAGVPQVYAGRYLSWTKPAVLEEKLRECDILQVTLPWQAGYLHRINKTGKPLVFVAHNVEGALWEKINSNGRRSFYRSWVINETYKQEMEAFNAADAVIAVSDIDREQIIEQFKIREERVFFIPHGVDTEKYRVHTEDERNKAKVSLGLSGKRVVVFSGAFYGPNVEAVKEILDIAVDFNGDTIFVIVGRVGEAFKGISVANVIFTGFVDDPVHYFAAADVAINPMSSGSGMHLKMLEYLSSGLPVVTTGTGARGLKRPWKDYIIVSELKGFTESLRSVLNDRDMHEYYSRQGRKVVEESYTWDRVAKERIRIYEML